MAMTEVMSYEAENKRINKSKETLKAQKTELEAQLKTSRDASVNGPQLEDFIRDIQDKLPNLDFEGKLLALDMLGITVHLNDQEIEITGIIEPIRKLNIVPQSSRRLGHNTPISFSLKISV